MHLRNALSLLMIQMSCLLFGKAQTELEDGSIIPRTETNVSRIHTFFYLWYGNLETDGKYLHWNHAVLPHWTENVRNQFPHGHHHRVEEGEIHAPYYPLRGTYSSSNIITLEKQMLELREAGVGTVILSWWGQESREGTSDTQGVQTDSILPVIIGVVESVPGMTFGLHLEPYSGRSAASVVDDIQYLSAKYGNSSAWARIDNRRIFYVYDSYHVKAEDWAAAFRDRKNPVVKDAFLIALWLTQNGGFDALNGGFDGVYSYFASDGFSFGSSTKNWYHMEEFCDNHGLIFIPSVGPGYNDEGIRPWNTKNSKSRKDGAYYDNMWQRALQAGATFISITSYNEWGEGTQIEPARATKNASSDEIKTYNEYPQGDPMFYMKATRRWADQLEMLILQEQTQKEL